ncbi:hypothetical protein L596_008776 [Steinernema carpocapsae]|uniref:Serpin domain-containing protein n=1 Tax=Steinernema carpocapsae TaxID=34508 RepID=A0A4U5PDQ1_STECR|nr:hypothetical protein L596_008776 [Steinernema carpocapsae]
MAQWDPILRFCVGLEPKGGRFRYRKVSCRPPAVISPSPKVAWAAIFGEEPVDPAPLTMRFLSLLLFFLVPSFILALYDLISAAALLDAHFRLGIQTLQLSSKKSSVVSLFSILTSLGALNTGLEGKASEEITEKIFNGMDKKKVNDWLYSWYTDESMALKIYFDKNVTVKEEFLYKMFRYYFTDTENVDFTSNAENLRQEINEFVENKTAGHFREFYAPGATFEKTQALMVNAIHMKKKWPLPFEAEKNRKDVFMEKVGKGGLRGFMERPERRLS